MQEAGGGPGGGHDSCMYLEFVDNFQRVYRSTYGLIRDAEDF